MTWTQTTEGAALDDPKVLGDKRYGRHLPIIIPFNATIPASPGAGGVIPLGATAPAGFKPRAVFFSTDGLSASGGVGLTVVIGDSGDPDRLMASLDADAATVSWNLAVTGYDYEYTADTVLNMTILSGKTPVAGQKISGFVLGSVRM